jgi:hypothetical protein
MLKEAEGGVPFVMMPEDIRAMKRGDYSTVSIPMIGYDDPPGWKLTDRADGVGVMGDKHGLTLVDSSGFGTRGELALTLDQFAEWVRPGYGYGIYEVGQFQVVVGEYEKTGEGEGDEEFDVDGFLGEIGV